MPTSNNNQTQIVIDDRTLDDYKKTAIKWQSVLQELPIAQAEDVLKYMHGIKGLRGVMRFGEISAKSQFGPYNPDRVVKSDVNIKHRDLETFMGSVIEKFHPNDYAFWTMGYNSATRGDAQKKATTALIVLKQICKARGEALAYAIFNGVRKEDGDKTVDLFDGFHTIADKEIEAGNISATKGNLYTLTEAVTKLNAVDIAKDIIFGLDPYLRRTPSLLFCSQDFADKYNEAYLETHTGLVYNTKYNQPVIEGSNGNVTLCPLAELDGTTKFYLTPKDNMLWGTDNDSDKTQIVVDRFESFRLTLSSTMFFGVQFHSLDKRRMKVINLVPPAPEKEPEPANPQEPEENN